MNDFGTVEFEDNTITLTSAAEPSSRLLPDNLTGCFEMTASGVDSSGNNVKVSWIFEDEPDWDLADYDYIDVYSVTTV